MRAKLIVEGRRRPLPSAMRIGRRRKRRLAPRCARLVGIHTALSAALLLAAGCSSLIPLQTDRLRIERVKEAVLPMASVALEAGQLETARRLYRRLLDVDLESFRAHMGLGDVALRERASLDAARWYALALEMAQTPEQRHEALLAHGRAALEAGQLNAARESFAQLIDLEEQAPQISVAWGYNGLGLVLLLEGDLEGAVERMRQAVRWGPNEPRFRENLERALAMLAGVAPAPDEAEVAAAARPEGPEPGEDPPSAEADAAEPPESERLTALPEPAPVEEPAAAEPGFASSKMADPSPVREDDAGSALVEDGEAGFAGSKMADPAKPEAPAAAEPLESELAAEDLESRPAGVLPSDSDAAEVLEPGLPPATPSPRPDAGDAEVAPSQPPAMVPDPASDAADASPETPTAEVADAAPAEVADAVPEGTVDAAADDAVDAVADGAGAAAADGAGDAVADGTDKTVADGVGDAISDSAADAAADGTADAAADSAVDAVSDRADDVIAGGAVDAAAGGAANAVADGVADAAEDGADAAVAEVAGDAISGGAADAAAGGADQAVADGVDDAAAGGVADAIADSASDAVSGGMDDAVTDGTSDAVSDRAAEAVSGGAADVVAEAAADAVTEGEADAVADEPVQPAPAEVPDAAARPDPTQGFALVEDGQLFVQMGAYALRSRALNLAARLRSLTDLPVRVLEPPPLHRVRIGPVGSPAALSALSDALEAAGFSGIRSVPSVGAVRRQDADAEAGLPPSRPLVVTEGEGRFMQFGAYRVRAAAETLALRLRGLIDEPVVVTEIERDGAPLHRVRAGPIRSEESMRALRDAAASLGFAAD